MYRHSLLTPKTFSHIFIYIQYIVKKFLSMHISVLFSAHFLQLITLFAICYHLLLNTVLIMIEGGGIIFHPANSFLP